MRICILVVAVSLTTVAAAATLAQTASTTPEQEQYLCAVDHAAGLTFGAAEKSWHSTAFRPDAKYIVSKSDRQGEAFQITPLGQKFALYRCKEGFNEVGYLDCDGVGQFRFNKRNGRFLVTYIIAYVHVGIAPESTDANSDTPSVAIGKCSPF